MNRFNATTILNEQANIYAWIEWRIAISHIIGRIQEATWELIVTKILNAKYKCYDSIKINLCQSNTD